MKPIINPFPRNVRMLVREADGRTGGENIGNNRLLCLPRPRGRCAACSGFFFFRRRTSVIGSQNFHKKRSFNPRYGPIPFLSFWRVRAWKQAWRTWETSTHSRLITGKQKQQKTIRWSRQKRTSNAKNIFLSLFFVVLFRMEMQALITSTEKVTTKKRMGRAFSRKTLVGKGRN